MAHELSKVYHSNEYRMMYRERDGKGKPWHSESTKVKAWTSDPSIEQAIQDLEAYVKVILRPVYDQDGRLIPEIQETFRPVSDATGNPLFDTEGKMLGDRLGIVGPDYTIFQDSETLEWFRPWVDAGVVTIETGGAIFNHSRFWALAKVNKDPVDIVPGDTGHTMEQYVTVINGHDGKLAFKGFPTDVLVVCANTASLALQSSLAKKFSAKHRKVVHLKADEIRAEVSEMQGLFLQSVEKYKLLAGSDLPSEEQLKLYFQKVLGKKEDADQEVDKDSKRPLGTLIRLMDELEYLQVKNVSGTWWAAFNAVTNFATHLHARNSDQRLDAMFSGKGAEMIGRGLDFALAGANGQLAQAA